jgi:hypothetical protein
MTEATAQRVNRLLGLVNTGMVVSISLLREAVEEIVRVERIDVLKTAVDRVEKEVADHESLDILMSMLDDEEAS